MASGKACANVDALRPGSDRESQERDEVYSLNKKSWGGYVIGFFVLGLLAWIALSLARPTWVQTRDATGAPTGVLDNGKLLGGSIIVALIGLALIWLIKRR